MDPARFNTNVLKEPRGMIRIIQLAFAILAFSTTSSFDTTTSFTISCYNQSDSERHYERTIVYPVEYPFDFSDTSLTYLNGCGAEEMTSKKLDIDFSSSAQFFVATGVLCFLYTIAAEVWYIMYSSQYENNQFFPLVDLAITAIFAVFWLAGASAWATNVSDIKHYAGPRYLIEQLGNCNKTVKEYTYNCFPESPGKWSTLYISLIFGFANMFLWAASMWFVYKETIFHRKTLQPQPTGLGGTYPGISSQTGMTAGQMGGMMPDQTQQQQMLAQQQAMGQQQAYGQAPQQAYGQAQAGGYN